MYIIILLIGIVVVVIIEIIKHKIQKRKGISEEKEDIDLLEQYDDWNQEDYCNCCNSIEGRKCMYCNKKF